MSGHWPPEWDDPEEEFPEGADQADTEAEARLSEVSAYLASVPAPVLPDAVEARISAALTAEAAARAEHAGPADSAPVDGARKLEPSGARARVRRHRGGGPRRRFRVRPQVVGGSLVTCLLLAILGFALSHASFSSSSSSSAVAGSAAKPAEASSSAASSAAGAGTAPSAAGPQYAGTGSPFVVTASGTRYQPATLAEQVRTRLGAGGTHATSGTTVPAASASATSAAAIPSPALRGCVLQLTDGVPPRLVDRATYESEPAYIIASSNRVWVVEPGCTAAKTEVVASVPLAS
jgi:hypothetical protein